MSAANCKARVCFATPYACHADGVVFCGHPAGKHHEYITSAVHGTNERLLDILLRRSVSDFNQFIDCLEETGQLHLATMLRTGAGPF